MTGGTLPLEAEANSSSAVAHVKSWRMPRADLISVYENHCAAAAFFRFGRAPFVIEGEKPETLVVGDLRYDRQRDLDFAELEIDETADDCPEFVPAWLPPRRDALGAR
jgi:hypothetical protein